MQQFGAGPAVSVRVTDVQRTEAEVRDLQVAVRVQQQVLCWGGLALEVVLLGEFVSLNGRQL